VRGQKEIPAQPGRPATRAKPDLQDLLAPLGHRDHLVLRVLLVLRPLPQKAWFGLCAPTARRQPAELSVIKTRCL
jgi:hypothetical protein